MVAGHYKKDDLLHCGLAVGYFRLPSGHSQMTWHCRSTAGARHSMCELTHGIAGERHGMCESALRLTFILLCIVLKITHTGSHYGGYIILIFC